jgi:hypothetical protein
VASTSTTRRRWKCVTRAHSFMLASPKVSLEVGYVTDRGSKCGLDCRVAMMVGCTVNCRSANYTLFVLASGHWVCLNAGGDSCSHGTTQVDHRFEFPSRSWKRVMYVVEFLAFWIKFVKISLNGPSCLAANRQQASTGRTMAFSCIPR